MELTGRFRDIYDMVGRPGLEELGGALPRLGIQAFSPLMLSKKKDTKRAGVSGRWGQVTRMPGREGREFGIREVQIKKILSFRAKVLVLFSSKNLY